MSFIKEKLADAHKKRELYHQQRLNAEMPVVSLVGYTSSGKTTLFNLLTSENKDTASSLFTTLSTTTRSFKIDSNHDRGTRGDLLLIDTVGFISRLPHYMIDAFKSTLEESLASDLILLLIDMSDKIEDIRIKYESCWDVLDELKVDKSKVFVILTKFDSVIDSEQMKNDIANNLKISNPIVISSKTGYGIHKLKTVMGSRIDVVKSLTN
jgi:GTPase